MRSEKGITLVALIGIFVLIVILAGISIAIAARGNNETENPSNNTVNTAIDEYEDEELVVDPTAVTSTDNETENTTETVDNEVEDVEETVDSEVENDTTNTVDTEVVE